MIQSPMCQHQSQAENTNDQKTCPSLLVRLQQCPIQTMVAHLCPIHHSSTKGMCLHRRPRWSSCLRLWRTRETLTRSGATGFSGEQKLIEIIDATPKDITISRSLMISACMCRSTVGGDAPGWPRRTRTERNKALTRWQRQAKAHPRPLRDASARPMRNAEAHRCCEEAQG